MKKKIMTLLSVALFTLMMIPANVMAKGVSMDRGMKEVCDIMSAYTTAVRLSTQNASGQMDLSLDNDSRLSIAAFSRFYRQDDFGFTAKELKKESKDLFGKTARMNSLKKAQAGKMLVCTADKKYVDEPYMYCGGEFGDTVVSYKVTKVDRLNKNSYQVVLRNRIGVYGEKGNQTIGQTILRLKKNKTSKYGYTVKSVAIR